MKQQFPSNNTADKHLPVKLGDSCENTTITKMYSFTYVKCMEKNPDMFLSLHL